jgi:hypothetical protein
VAKGAEFSEGFAFPLLVVTANAVKALVAITAAIIAANDRTKSKRFMRYLLLLV